MKPGDDFLNERPSKQVNEHDHEQVDWFKYINGELDDKHCHIAEWLLESNGAALEAYMRAMAELESSLPKLEDEQHFADRVMNMLPNTSDEWAATVSQLQPKPSLVPASMKASSDTSERRKREIHFSKRPLFHYILAASITLCLLSLGAFDSPLPEEGKIILPSTKPSISKQFLDTTSGWLDELKP